MERTHQLGEGAATRLFNAAAAIASAVGAILGGAVADTLGHGAVSVFPGSMSLVSLICVAPLMRQRLRTPQHV